MAGRASTSQAAPKYNDIKIPTTMEQLVQFLLSTSDPGAAAHVLKNIGTTETREQFLATQLASGEDPLTVLNVENNTLGWLYILSARLTVLNGTTVPSLEMIQKFCQDFKPEAARLAPSRITLLAKGLVRVAADNQEAILAPLYNLVTRYPPTPTHLTNLHPIFLNACVTTRHFAAALPVLTSPILNVDVSIAELNWNDNLLYHYAGGVAFGALKRWKEAEEFFEICVTAPAQAPAAIQYEALKKLTLVQLIIYGKVMQPPKYAHQTLVRHLKNSPYQSYARGYPQTRTALISTIPQKDADLYKTEQNWGLIQQTIDRAPRWLIRKLTRTYLTMGLRDIAKEANIESEEEVRSIIVSMIEADEINAKISVDGTVTFIDTTPQVSKADIDRALADAQAQGKLLADLERAMNISKDYLHKALKHKDENWGAAEEDIYVANAGFIDDGLYA